MTTLSPSERLKMKKGLIAAGKKPAGLDDDQLTQEYGALSGKPLEAKPEMVEISAEEIEAAIEQAEEKPAIAAVPNNPAINDLQKALQALMPQQQSASPVDEATLIRLIQEHATQTIVVERVELGDSITIEGAHPMLDDLILMAKARAMVYLVGPAGSGKTTLAAQCAEALGLDFYSTGSVMASYELLGAKTAHGDYMETSLYLAYKLGGVFLFDEIDGNAPRALLAINQLLANNRFTFPNGETVERHKDFVAIAAANTVGTGANRQYTGRAQLDGATLDRFIYLEIDYCKKLELRLATAEYKALGGDCDSTLADWVLTVQSWRAAAENIGSTHIISPRASIVGAKLLAVGMEKRALIERCIIKGMPADQVKQVRQSV